MRTGYLCMTDATMTPNPTKSVRARLNIKADTNLTEDARLLAKQLEWNSSDITVTLRTT